MAVQAKFYVSKLEQFGSQPHPTAVYDPQINVTLGAVFGDGDHPNAEWSRFTPSGEIEMTVTNPDVLGFFEAGVEYNVTFTRAQPQKARSTEEFA